MRRKNFKGRCEKIHISKSKEVCRLYDPIQRAYLSILEQDAFILEIRCNVPLTGLEYMTDFVCKKNNCL